MQTKSLQTKRALRTALLVLLLSVAGMGKGYAQLANVVIGDLKYSLYDNGTAQVNGHIDGPNATGNLIIPSTVTYTFFDPNGQGHSETFTVTRISCMAFWGCSGLTGELVIPNTITSMGHSCEYPYFHGAFMDCSGFTSLTIIGGSLADIPYGTFYGCTGLTDVVIPSSVTTIGDRAFYDCTGLNSVHYMGTLDQWLNIEFGFNPLSYAHNLYINNELVTNLVIPEYMTEIKNQVFSGATCLESLTIPNSVTTIGAFAFRGCSGLTSLTIPNSVTTMLTGVFQGCSGLTGSLVIPSSLTEIADLAFAGCSGFTGDLTIPNTITEIGYEAFLLCTGFTGDLVIPNSVTRLGWGAFHGCNGLTGDLVIPRSVSFIGDACFLDCIFSTVHYNATNCDDVLGIGADVYGSEWPYSYPFENCIGQLIIGDNVERIPERMFMNGGFTGVLAVPNSVTSIGESAFSECRGFTGGLVIPNSIESIGAGAFFGCSGLSGDLIISNSVAEIGEWAFCDCSGFVKCIALGETPPHISGSYTPFDESLTHLIVPCGSKANYEAAGWDNYFSIIEEDCAQYSVNIDNNSSNGGTIIVSTNSAYIGEEVQITVTPNTGMSLSSLTVCNSSDPSQTVPVYPVGKASSTYAFLMPPYDMTVKAVFVVDNSVGDSNGIVMSVYPNPTNGQVIIEAEGIKHISISNVQGQQIFDGKASGNEFEYNFSGQKAGLYFVRIETANGVAVKKVSVTR